MKVLLPDTVLLNDISKMAPGHASLNGKGVGSLDGWGCRRHRRVPEARPSGSGRGHRPREERGLPEFRAGADFLPVPVLRWGPP